MDGTADAGTSDDASRSDHVHPHDTDLLPTDTVSGDPVSITDGFPVNARGLSVALEPIQDLHGYESPWPAGGGANQWDEEWRLASLNVTTGIWSSIGTYSQIASANMIPIKPNTTYYFASPNDGGAYMAEYRADGSYIGYVFTRASNRVFTTPSDCAFVMFQMNNYGNVYNNDIAINYPSTVTTYSPYTNICPITGHDSVSVVRTDGDGQQSLSLTIPLGQTVYGGEVDFTAGVLRIDKESITLQNIPSGTAYIRNISELTDGVRFEYYPYRAIGVENGVFVSDKFAYASTSDGTPYCIGGSAYVRMYMTLPSEYNTEALIRGWFSNNPTQVVWVLATPITVTLTPQDLMMLLGDNVVTSDGTITLDYYCDVTRYIAKKIAEVQALILEG